MTFARIVPSRCGALLAFSSTDFRGNLEAIGVPARIVHGTGDRSVPIDASSREAARLIPGSVRLEYKGAPQGLFASHRERPTRDLPAFFGKGSRITTD